MAENKKQRSDAALRWFIKTSAFILLPLLVYFVVYFAMGNSIVALFKLPEWMFVAIILYGNAMLEVVFFLKETNNFDDNTVRPVIAFGILGIVISAVFLVLSIIAQLGSQDLSTSYYILQFFLFLASFAFSSKTGIWLDVERSGRKHFTGWNPL